MLPDNDASGLQALRDKIGDVDGSVRVIKHEIANMKQASLGDALRFEKFEDRTIKQFDEVRKEIKDFGDTLSGKISDLSTQISAVNVKQEKGAGFVAGVGAVLTVCITIILFIAKLLFGGHP